MPCLTTIHDTKSPKEETSVQRATNDLHNTSTASLIRTIPADAHGHAMLRHTNCTMYHHDLEFQVLCIPPVFNLPDITDEVIVYTKRDSDSASVIRVWL